jgi:glycosyltransferase involved in cell wall biosynthesis
MSLSVSIIIPNRNGEATIADCLEAAIGSDYDNFEVIVVDDFSIDRSVEIIRQFTCQLVTLDRHSGASSARNIGAAHSRGELLFFTDSDCMLGKKTLRIAVDAIVSAGPKTLLGGTYTRRSADNRFFSCFQSVFINYSETKNASEPDYVATHAMIIAADEFKNSGGFAERFLPILEDVEFSHRLGDTGFRLLIDPQIQLRHYFGFTMLKSMGNAFRKSLYWTAYSLHNGDLHKDSGAASIALKLTTLNWLLSLMLLIIYLGTGEILLMVAIVLGLCAVLILNRGLLTAFYQSRGTGFLVIAASYYLLLYPLAVSAGGMVGAVFFRRYKNIMIGRVS